jgi:PAS domain S-box-containing protein
MDQPAASVALLNGEKRFQLLVGAVTDYAIFMLDLHGVVVSWNSGAQRIKGYTADEIIGQHFSQFYTPEDQEADLPARALATAARDDRFEKEGWRVRKGGTRFWANVVIDPIRDDAGQVIGFAKVTRDISERRKAELALKESEERFRLLVQGVTDYAIYMLDPQGYITNWNSGAERIKGYTAEEIVGHHFSRFYPEEDRDAGLPAKALDTAVREGRFEKEGWRVRKDGTRLWANVIIDPIRDEQGTLIGFAKITRDITERKQAQEALERVRAEEKRHFQTLNQTIAQVSAELDLQRLVQTVTDAGVSLTGAQFGAFFYNVTDAQGDALTLYTISGVPREHFSKFPNPRATHVFAPTFRGDGPVRSDDILADPRYGQNAPHKGMPDGHLPVRSYLAVPVKSRSGEVMGGLFFGHAEPGRFTARHEELLIGIAGQAAIGIDNARLYDAAQREIADRKAAEKHRELLINELNHRVKNSLATVQSIAANTLRNGGVDAEVRHRLDARLMALSDAHNLLTEHNWETATLAEVVEMSLRPHRSQRDDRFDVQGPEVHLHPKTALAIALALHELATNAMKYGALSQEGGRVAVRWQITEGDIRPRLHMEWVEQGGPPLTPPTRKGFGTRLIERGLAADLGGTVRLTYPITGAVCTIDCPLPRITFREGVQTHG